MNADYVIQQKLRLPNEWSPDDIPTGDELQRKVEARLIGLRSKISDLLIVPEDLLSDAFEIIHIATEFPALISLTVDFGLSLKAKAFDEGRLGWCRALLVKLYFAVTQYADRISNASEYINCLAVEFMNLLMANEARPVPPNAIFEHALEAGLSEPDSKEWLLAYAAYLNATAFNQPFESALEKCLTLLKLTQDNKNTYAQMRVHLTLARLYSQRGELEKSFAHAQQALVIAVVLNKRVAAADCLTYMFRPIFGPPPNELYVQQLFAFWQSEPPAFMGMYEQAHFYGQLGPYFGNRHEYEKATPPLERAIDLFGKLGDRLNQARMMQALGIVLTKLKEWDLAAELFGNARALYRQLKQPEHRVWVMHCIGWQAAESGDRMRAIKKLNTALKMACLLPPTPFAIRLCNEIKADLDNARSAKVDS